MPAFITGETPQEQKPLETMEYEPELVQTISDEAAIELRKTLDNMTEEEKKNNVNNPVSKALYEESIEPNNNNTLGDFEREKVIDANHGSGVGHPYWEDNNITPTVKPKKPYISGFFETRIERFGFIMFMLPIILMSAVSMIHLVDFFKIGTNPFTAWLLAVAFELASLSTISALILLKKMKKSLLIVVFFLLYALQMLGNIYAPFSFIEPAAAQKLFQFFGFTTVDVNAQRYVAIIEGAILPTVNLFLFKMASNYLNTEKKDI